MKPGIYWCVYDLVTFDPQFVGGISVEVKAPAGSVGWFCVFDTKEAANAFASDPARVQCIRIRECHLTKA